jgi:hypothetical protein
VGRSTSSLRPSPLISVASGGAIVRISRDAPVSALTSVTPAVVCVTTSCVPATNDVSCDVVRASGRSMRRTTRFAATSQIMIAIGCPASSVAAPASSRPSDDHAFTSTGPSAAMKPTPVADAACEESKKVTP